MFKDQQLNHWANNFLSTFLVDLIIHPHNNTANPRLFEGVLQKPWTRVLIFLYGKGFKLSHYDHSVYPILNSRQCGTHHCVIGPCILNFYDSLFVKCLLFPITLISL